MSKVRTSKARSAHSASDEDWAEAVRREAAIRPLTEAPLLGRLAVQAAAKSLGLSVPRIYSLIRAFRSHPVTASMLPHPPGPAAGWRRLPPAVEAKVETAIDAIYLKPERPTVKRLLGHVRQECVTAGLKPPSMKALRARVTARSLRERIKHREGAAIAGERFRLVKPGLRTERPLQVVQIDHTKVDIMLVDDVTRACIGRPWLTLVIDVHTRMVAGLTLSLDPPSAAGTALTVTQAVLPKAEWLKDRAIGLDWPTQGLPEAIHVDNGAEFHSRAFERGCQQHGIRIDYRPPATPRFGGHIERLMGTLMGRIHALPGTTFSGVAARGDYASEARAVLSFREFERILVLEVLGPYHSEVHTALGYCATIWVRESGDQDENWQPQRRHDVGSDCRWQALSFGLIVGERQRAEVADCRAIWWPPGAFVFSFEGSASPVAVDVDFENRSVMHEAIDGGESHGGIREDLPPCTERLIGGDGSRAALVAGADEFEQDGCFSLILADVGEIIEDQQVEAIEPIDGGLECQLASREL